MASITPRKNKDGKIISYQIEVYPGRDSSGKKLKPYSMNWRIQGWKESSIQKELRKDTGVRRGEIMGLKWSTINFDASEIGIENNPQYTVAKGLFDETVKTEENRVVPIAKPIARPA